MKGELEYRAVVTVGVDLETGEVELVTVRAATDDDERVDLSVSLDSDEEQPDEVYERAQQIVDAGAPFELSGWWAPSPDQRWGPGRGGRRRAGRRDRGSPANGQLVLL